MQEWKQRGLDGKGLKSESREWRTVKKKRGNRAGMEGTAVKERENTSLAEFCSEKGVVVQRMSTLRDFNTAAGWKIQTDFARACYDGVGSTLEP